MALINPVFSHYNDKKKHFFYFVSAKKKNTVRYLFCSIAWLIFKNIPKPNIHTKLIRMDFFFRRFFFTINEFEKNQNLHIDSGSNFRKGTVCRHEVWTSSQAILQVSLLFYFIHSYTNNTSLL